MAKTGYCDTKELEAVWGNWDSAKAFPELDGLRASELLYRKFDGKRVLYCVAITGSFGFTITDVTELGSIIADTRGNPLDQNVANALLNDNFRLDLTATNSWERLTKMIYDTCNGISLKFNPGCDDERFELAHEAFKQTLLKIQRDKLRFTPGRAPVFNLLTTAIIRIMCSIKNKEKRNRNNQAKLAHDVMNNSNLPKLRSLAIAASHFGGERYLDI